jgi:hypothetical protein
MSHLTQVLKTSSVLGRRDAVLRWDGAKFARNKRGVGPRCLVKSLVSSVLVGTVNLKEIVHEEWRQQADLADDTGERTSGIRAAREAEYEDLVAGTPVVCEVIVRLADVFSKAASKGSFKPR